MPVGARNIGLALGLLCAAAQAPLAADPSSAPAPALMMPRAASSLLLDAAHAGEALVAVGERGHILRSTDAGRSWRQVPSPVQSMLTGVHFVDATQGWAVGHDGVVLHTADGGIRWTLQREGLAAQRELDRAAVAAARARLAALESDGAAAGGAALAGEIEDARRDLEDAQATLEEPVFAPPLFDVWFADAARGLAVGAYGSALATTDGGATWTDARGRIDDPDRRHLYAIASPDAGVTVLVAGEGGAMFRSRDGGARFAPLDTGHAGTLFALVATPAGIHASGLEGTLLLSADAGDTWRQLAAPVDVALNGAQRAGDGSVWVVGGMGTLLRVRGSEVTVAQGSDRRVGFAAVIEAGDGVPVALGQGGAERLAAAVQER